MKLNEAVIPHYRSEMIPISKLKKLVSLNKKYLEEKPTWYEIDGKIQYFKVRNDFRLFTEQFFSMFGREIMGLDTLDYTVSYVRTISVNGEETKCGLLSQNFQEPKYNYYLISELMNAEISSLIFYGGYSLENMLKFFYDSLVNDDYTKNELFLIKLFISDAFTHQEDRNYHNIGFKIPKIEGVPYTKRLNTSYLKDNRNAKKSYTVSPDGRILLKGFTPTKVYDNERILGTDHKNMFSYTEGQIWCPLFPYSEETLFKTQEEAQEYSKAFDGLDPNLFNLYMNHTETCQPFFERLAYDDEYKRILERFNGETCQINLSDDEIEWITNLFEDKRKAFRKILTY